MRDSLTDTGYAPLLLGDHRQLARVLASETPALVLLDLVLPGTDGIELMESVPGLADLPVIFISGYGRDETIARALEAGADDYIVKPFSPTELTARIQAALRRRADSLRRRGIYGFGREHKSGAKSPAISPQTGEISGLALLPAARRAPCAGIHRAHLQQGLRRMRLDPRHRGHRGRAD